MAINVAQVATDKDLSDEVGGDEALQGIIPKAWVGSALRARKRALSQVIRALANKQPPLYEQDLQDVSELKMAVVYGSLAQLYRMAKTSGDRDEVFVSLQKDFQTLFTNEVMSLNPTVVGGSRGATFSIPFHRG